MQEGNSPLLDFDAVVIGSGLGGLLCADTLASKGKRVALLESHEFPGGFCSSFERNGYLFDTVVDSIGGLDDRGVLGNIFRRLGLLDRLGAIRLDPVRENFFGDRPILIPADLDAYRDELCRHFPAERQAITVFLALLTRLFREIRSVSMRELHEETASTELKECRDLTWTEFAERHVSAGLADALAERICFLGLPPSRCSAIAMIAMLMNYFDGGAYRIRGGYQKLPDLLVSDIRARGGLVRLQCPVERILIRNGESVGVRLASGEELRSSVVVSSADVRSTLDTLIGADHLPRTLTSSLKPLHPSLSFIVIHLGITGSVEGLFRASSIGYYPGGNVERSYRYVENRLQESDLFIGFGIPTMNDPSLAPPGRHIVSIHHPVPIRQFSDWASCRETIADSLIRKMERVFPGLTSRIEHRSIATPRTFERYTGSREGVAYGWEHTPDRWRNVARLQELFPARFFQVGHWSDYGGGTVSAAISGHEVAQKILRGCLRQNEEFHHVG